MRNVVSVTLLLATLVAAPCLAQEAVKAPADGATFVAPGVIGSVADMKAFADEFWAARFDLTKAAKVDKLVLTKDAARWTLTGWIFLKAPVRGVASRGIFFGDGRFELTPPIDMEKQQVKRFLGTESIDQPIEQGRFDFNGADAQRVFQMLTYTTDAATEAKAKSDKAREWLTKTERVYTKGLSTQQEADRRLQEYAYAESVYARLMDPGIDGTLVAAMDIHKAEGSDKPATTLMEMLFSYVPHEQEEIRVTGTFDHGDDKYESIITSFACCGKYAGDIGWAATSPVLEAQNKQKTALARDALRIRFDPGGSPDISMTATMDLVVLEDHLRMLNFGITETMGTKHAWVDGKPCDFVQPEIPGVPGLYARGIDLSLPRPYNKGEHVEVKLEVEGKLLKDVDGSTWEIKDEDAWFPNPHPQREDGLFWFSPMATVYDTTMIAPKGFTCISNGAETPCEGEVAAGNDCVRFVTNVGIDWPMFNIGRSMQIDKGTAEDGTPIAVFTCKEAKREFDFRNYDNPNLIEHRSYSLSNTGDTMVQLARLAHKTYEYWFGDDPYNRLYLTPHDKGLGRGSASLLLLDQSAFLSPTNQSEFASLNQVVYEPWRNPAFIAHEIAHQWWGGRSGIRSYRDQWFSEGFADFGCNIVMENYDIVNKTNWKTSQLAEWMGFLTKDDGYINTVSPLALGLRIVSSQNRRGYEGYYQPYIYSKGALVMQMLRTIARAKEGDKNKGDELFRKAIHDFMEWCTGKHPSNYDLMTQFSKSYGMRLDWFFKQWVYGLGIPKIDFSYQVVPAADGKGWMLRGHVKQKDTAFLFPVSVSLHQKGEKGDVPYIYQWIQRQDDTFEKGPIPFQPDRVTLNEDAGLLAIINTVPWQ